MQNELKKSQASQAASMKSRFGTPVKTVLAEMYDPVVAQAEKKMNELVVNLKTYSKKYKKTKKTLRKMKKTYKKSYTFYKS